MRKVSLVQWAIVLLVIHSTMVVPVESGVLDFAAYALDTFGLPTLGQGIRNIQYGFPTQQWIEEWNQQAQEDQDDLDDELQDLKQTAQNLQQTVDQALGYPPRSYPEPDPPSYAPQYPQYAQYPPPAYGYGYPPTYGQ